MIRSKTALASAIAAATAIGLAGGLLLGLVQPYEAFSADETPSDALARLDETRSTLNRSAVLNQRADGHFWGNALVNERSHIDFMVDTGASVIALTPQDARRIGLDPDTLDYSWDVKTAGGDVKGASVLLDSIRIHQVEIRNVEAVVLQEQLASSLLGMSYLTRLYSYEFRGARLIIRQ